MRLLPLLSIFLFLVSCKKEDTTQPDLQLLGSDTVTQWLPATAGAGYYIDAGVIAKDNEDGNITGNVLVENLVNPNRKGTYLVKYSVQDEAGNVSTVQRVVFITNAAEIFSGNYFNCVDTCTASTVPTYSMTILSSDTVNRLLWLNNFGNTGEVMQVRALLTDTNVSVPLNQYIDLALTKFINSVFAPTTDIISATPPTRFRIKYSWTDGTSSDTCTTWIIR